MTFCCTQGFPKLCGRHQRLPLPYSSEARGGGSLERILQRSHLQCDINLLRHLVKDARAVAVWGRALALHLNGVSCQHRSCCEDNARGAT